MRLTSRNAAGVVGGSLVAALLGACFVDAGGGESQGASAQAASASAASASSGNNGGGSDKLNALEFANASGVMRTYTDNVKTMLKPNKTKNIPFFNSLGTNGRACIHCHIPGDGWTITPASVTYRFTHPLDPTSSDCAVNVLGCTQEPNSANYGMDPIFRPNDGANSPLADVSTAVARQAAYSMLMTKGLIRVGIGIPPGAEFVLDAVSDPYNFASARELSLFRRPLPTTNLRLSPLVAGGAARPTLTAVMWDGRETLPGRDIVFDLLDQANGATLGHAQAAAGLSDADRQAIVDFETGLHTAQSVDTIAGPLNGGGATGGVDALALQDFYVGINDVLVGDIKTGAAFTPGVFNLYSAWAGSLDAAKAQVARGQALFNGKRINITQVGGLNDALGVETIPGTCTTCHDAPNYGHHSVKLPINIGTADGSRRTDDMPLYTLRNVATGATVQTTDPGRALISGKWADIGKFKGPILRGLAGRAPYFHNGMAASLADAVTFYNGRFSIGFTEQEKADLVAFLKTL
jgi:cytochrome c peroxidase